MVQEAAVRPREDCTWPRDGCSGGERWPPYVEVGPPVSVSNALQGCQNTFPLPGTPSSPHRTRACRTPPPRRGPTGTAGARAARAAGRGGVGGHAPRPPGTDGARGARGAGTRIGRRTSHAGAGHTPHTVAHGRCREVGPSPRTWSACVFPPSRTNFCRRD